MEAGLGLWGLVVVAPAATDAAPVLASASAGWCANVADAANARAATGPVALDAVVDAAVDPVAVAGAGLSKESSPGFREDGAGRRCVAGAGRALVLCAAFVSLLLSSNQCRTGKGSADRAAGDGKTCSPLGGGRGAAAAAVVTATAPTSVGFSVLSMYLVVRGGIVGWWRWWYIRAGWWGGGHMGIHALTYRNTRYLPCEYIQKQRN